MKVTATKVAAEKNVAAKMKELHKPLILYM